MICKKSNKNARKRIARFFPKKTGKNGEQRRRGHARWSVAESSLSNSTKPKPSNSLLIHTHTHTEKPTTLLCNLATVSLDWTGVSWFSWANLRIPYRGQRRWDAAVIVFTCESIHQILMLFWRAGPNLYTCVVSFIKIGISLIRFQHRVFSESLLWVCVNDISTSRVCRCLGKQASFPRRDLPSAPLCQ